jgi:hypothetical protein
MTLEEALAIIDAALSPKHLNNLQDLLFRGSWLGKKYQEIASEIGYDHDYIRAVGFQMWKNLSDAFGEKVTKNNFRSVLQRQVGKSNEELAPAAKPQAGVQVSSQPGKLPHLELPAGPVSLDSPFYLKRPPIEERCYGEILKPGALIRLRAPNQMGKTSLKNRILAHAENEGCRSVRLNFEQAEEAVLGNLNQFLRWCCANVSRQLQLPPKLDDYWDEDFGSKVSCTLYIQGYILQQLDSPLVLSLDEVNRLFEFPKIAHNFLPLLRSWYEEARDVDLWQKLRLILVHSTEIYVPLNISQSPFNVGLSICLPEFTPAQVQDLAQLHGLDWSQGSETERLIAMVGGHPYRVRLALYHLASDELSLETLLQEAPTLSGIYSHHLRHQWTTLQQNPALLTALEQVVKSESGVCIEPIPAYKLESMGVIKIKGNQVFPSCELYRLYFRSQLD